MAKFDKSQDLKIEFDTGLDTEGVEKDLEDLGSSVKSKIGAMVRGFGELGLAIEGVKGILDLASQGVVHLNDLMRDAFEMTKTFTRANLFGVLNKDISTLKDSTKGFISQIDALKVSTELRMKMFDARSIDNAGKLAQAIHVVTGATKDAALEMVKTGSIGEEVLLALGKTQADMDLMVSKAELRLGRELQEFEKHKMSVNFLADSIKKLQGNISKLDSISALDNLEGTIVDIKDAVLTQLAPSLNQLGIYVSKNIDQIASDLIDFGAKTWATFRDLGLKLKGWIDNLAVAWKVTSAPLRALLWTVGKISGAMRKTATVGGKSAKELSESWKKHYNNINIAAKKSTKVNGEAQKKLKEQLADLRKAMVKRLKKTAVESAAIDVIKGQREEAKALIREYEKNAMAAIGAIGGSAAGILSALQEIPAKFAVLGSLHQDAIVKTLGLTTKQVDKMREQGKLTEKQAKAANLFNLTLQAGELTLVEFVRNQETVNKQLQAANSLLASRAKLAVVNVEINNMSKDVLAGIKVFEEGLFVIQGKRAELEKKMFLAMRKNQTAVAKNLSAQIQVNEKQRSFLVRGVESYKKIATQKSIILDLMKKGAIIEVAEEKRRIADLSGDKIIDSWRKVLDSKEQLKTLNTGGTDQGRIELENATKQQEVSRRMRDFERERLSISQKIQSGVYANNQENLTIAKQRVEVLRQGIEAAKQEAVVIDQITQKQIKNTQTLGAFLQSAIQGSLNFAKTLGQTLYSSFQSGMGGIGNIISSTMESLVTGMDNVGASVGKMFLDVLAGASAQLGAYFILAGTAQMFVPPYSGAGAIAGGVALLALSGTLKGIGSLLSAPSASPSVGSGASPSIGTSVPTSIPGQDSGRGQQPVNFFFATSPFGFMKMDERETARGMKDFFGRMDRDGINVTEIPRRLNARRIG